MWWRNQKWTPKIHKITNLTEFNIKILKGGRLGYRNWFKGVFKEAGIKVTDGNREKIEESIHEVVGENSKY